MTAETDIAALSDGGLNPIAEIRTALTAVLARADGALIAYVAHAADSTYTTTSATFTDVDGTNLTIPFTVPSSGSVLVVLSSSANTSVLGQAHFWNLRDGSGDIAGTPRLATAVSAGGFGMVTVRIRVTGLTPGASLAWDWGFRVTGGATASVRAGTVGGNDFGPATMEVWAV